MSSLIVAILLAVLVALVFLLIISFFNRKDAAHERLEALTDDGEADEHKDKKLRGSSFDKAVQKSKRLTAMSEAARDAIRGSGLKISPNRFILIWMILAVGGPLFVYVMGFGMILTVVAIAVCTAGPLVYLDSARKKRTKEILKQYPNTLTIVCSAMSSGSSFAQALNKAAKEAPAPISEEFQRIYDESKLNMPIEKSMEAFYNRVPSPYILAMANAVATQAGGGGKLTDILEEISDECRTDFALKEECKAKTAGGRFTGILIGSLPVILILLLSVINKDYIQMFFTTTLGNIMLGAGLVWELIGFILIFKTVDIKY